MTVETTMDIRHHLDEATLMAYSAGTLGEALAAVAAAHVEICPQCRADIEDLDLFGGVMLDALAREPMSAAASVGAIRSDVVTLPRRKRPGGEVASVGAVARRLKLDLEGVTWRRLGPGMWHHPLPLSGKDKGDLRLLKIAPGRHMPTHGHGGTELTLVLQGAYSDERGTYGRGDIEDIDEDGEHQPVACPREGCICLIASERPARFKGLVAKLLQPLTGM